LNARLGFSEDQRVNIVRASLATSSALPQLFRFIIEIISGALEIS
jgi:hypothetical protein